MNKYKLVWSAHLLYSDYNIVEDKENDQMTTFSNSIEFDHMVLTSKVADMVKAQLEASMIDYFSKLHLSIDS